MAPAIVAYFLRIMKRWWIIIATLTLVGVLILFGQNFSSKSPLPANLTDQATSTVLVPITNDISVNRTTASYNPHIKLLVFSVQVGGIRTVFSEQPTPNTFVDIPQVYDRVIEQSQEYGSFETALGTVHLTRPRNAYGKQTAILNTRGTLLFVKPDKELSDSNWRQLFRALTVL